MKDGRWKPAWDLIEMNKNIFERPLSCRGCFFEDGKQYLIHGGGFYFIELTKRIDNLPIEPTHAVAYNVIKNIMNAREDRSEFKAHSFTAKEMEISRATALSTHGEFDTINGEKWCFDLALMKEAMRILGGKNRTLFVPPDKYGIGIVETSNGRLFICPVRRG